jgi:ribosomal protein S18 acetylase RimI-like enzyme
MIVTVRGIEARDETRWRELWDQYTRFYEREPREAITRQTWERIVDSRWPIHAIVAEIDGSPAESEREYVAGIANYVIHDSTSAIAPVCYLQDLYVDPANRAGGVGRMMIDWLVAEMKTQGWSRLYWQTRENNYRARGLYDKYTPHSGFVRYVIDNPLT